MNRFLALCLALSLVSIASIGCGHCMLDKETTETNSEAKSVESSEKTPPPAAP